MAWPTRKISIGIAAAVVLGIAVNVIWQEPSPSPTPTSSDVSHTPMTVDKSAVTENTLPQSTAVSSSSLPKDVKEITLPKAAIPAEETRRADDVIARADALIAQAEAQLVEHGIKPSTTTAPRYSTFEQRKITELEERLELIQEKRSR